MKQVGFTLIELLLVMVLVSILASIGFSSFTRLIEKSKANIDCQQLMRAIHFARTEAVMRHERVTLLPRISADWSKGYLARTNDKVLRAFSVNSLKIISWRAFPKQNIGLSFLPDGFSDFENGSFRGGWVDDFCE